MTSRDSKLGALVPTVKVAKVAMLLLALLAIAIATFLVDDKLGPILRIELLAAYSYGFHLLYAAVFRSHVYLGAYSFSCRNKPFIGWILGFVGASIALVSVLYMTGSLN